MKFKDWCIYIFKKIFYRKKIFNKNRKPPIQVCSMHNSHLFTDLSAVIDSKKNVCHYAWHSRCGQILFECIDRKLCEKNNGGFKHEKDVVII